MTNYAIEVYRDRFISQIACYAGVFGLVFLSFFSFFFSGIYVTSAYRSFSLWRVQIVYI